jgi:hypothetical protein
MIKFDDADFHVSDTLAKGQPVENAFTHIGFILAWLVRHRLVGARHFPSSIQRQVEQGQLPPNDLRDLVDGKLMRTALNKEGAGFLEAYYAGGYLADYEAEFADLPEYGVPDDPDHQARIDRRIDEAYEAWVNAGRPKSTDPQALWMPPGAVLARGDETELRPIRVVESEPATHLDKLLESQIMSAVDGPLATDSCDARAWGARGLLKALSRLGISPDDVVVVFGLRGLGGFTLEIERVPGVDSNRLAIEFKSYFENRVPGRWRDHAIGTLPARSRIATMPRLEPQTLLWFALDGWVVYLACADDAVDAMAKRLMDTLRR